MNAFNFWSREQIIHAASVDAKEAMEIFREFSREENEEFHRFVNEPERVMNPFAFNFQIFFEKLADRF